ncbi:MAG: S8 family serine peptidase, partial [Clostridia bacterium]|nr:S8 family serine peptidase [Clostridia bacterium]
MREAMKRITSVVLFLAVVLSLGSCANRVDEYAIVNGEAVILSAEQNADGKNDGKDAADTITEAELIDAINKAREEDGASSSEVTQLSSGKDTVELTREEMELVADILDTDVDVSALDDEELSGTVESLLEAIEKGSDVAQPDVYDENGGMKIPFDLAYPELIANGTVEYSDEALLIKMDNSYGGVLSPEMRAIGVGALEVIVPMDGATWYKASLLSDTTAEEALGELRELECVEVAEYDYQIRTASIDHYKDLPDDRHFDNNKHKKDQWYMHHFGIPDGYNHMKTDGGSESVIVAVIDTGVDYDHEDLADNIWRNTAEIPDNNIDDDKNGYVDDYYGVNVVAGKGNGDDDNGHGTHVAGIIAAQNNNLGTVGIAYNVTIMPIKAATASGFLNQSDIAEAVYYAYENGAEVINMSFGGSACSIAVQDALATAYTRCVLVASAGNDEENNEPTPVDPIYIPNYPAALTYVLGVMSVDENGVESNFTNYDVKAFNGVEYELYAPGDSIMSTLPGDTYGTLSGTSMAAPMVSAVAAILRSEYTDRDTYPTKFIYGQLASTSRYHATCLDPLAHGEHNLPQVVDLYSALTELPVPEVGVQDYALFDTEGLSYDTNGRNNGDGVIDAGETFALGLTLRNRWGMSEDTLVTIDTLSLAGIADPYITLHNPTVDYGSVGTYSTGDCGRVYTDGLLTGWESPFYVTVSDDCPNDYIFALNVTLRYENGLDESDKTVYINDKSTIILTVRNGVVLPSVIDTDMTLTSDNLYIIPNTTVIKEGVTVRVEAGTDIQFWTNDPEDPYADSYIASLTVGGRFLVEGTKEEPVRIYPSALMDRYAVSMSSSLNGFIALNYAEVVNPFMGNIDYADHCTFSYNYNDSIYYRTLSNGTVKTVDRGYGELPDFSEAKNCIFYKVGLPGVSSNTHFTLYGRIDRCIFVDCAIGFDDSRGSSSRGYMRNCVFLGNRVETEKGSVYHSTITAKNNKPADAISNIYYREQTGTTYILVDYNNIDSQLADELGLKYAIVETKDEAEWLQAKINRIGYDVGLKYDHNNEQYLWSDGTEIPDFIDCGEIKPVKINLTAALSVTYNNLSIIRNDYLGTTYCKLYELQGEILPTEITFDRYTVDLDVDTVYQIVPKNLPVQLSPEYFIYESGDTSVITVSDKGLVTPVGEGTADVTVYSRDRAVRNRITFTVRDYVPLESISFKTDSVNVAVGETVSVACTLTPADTTRNFVTYTSSDGDVVTVDAAGNINGISSGVATVTATCEGMTATITVRSFVKATSMEMDTIALSASLAEGERDLPDVITNEGAELQLIWRSVDESVATVENGKLVPRKTGTSTLVAEDTLSGLSCNALVIVREEAAPQIVEFLTAGSGSRNDDYFVLYDNGDLYQWDNVTGDVPEIYAQNVKDFDYNGYPIILYEDNTVSVGNFKFYDFSDKNPRAVVSGGVEYEWTGSSYFVLTESGNVYAWGYSHKGALGVGTVLDVTTPTLVNLDNVIKVVCDNGSDHTYFLTSDNKLYYAGEGILSPELVLECVDDILDISGKTLFIRYTDGKYAEFNSNHSTDFVFELPDLTVFDKYSYLQFLYNSDYIYGVGVVDGKVDMFKIRYTGATGFGNYIPGISDAIHTVMLKTSSKASYYVATAGGLLLGYGANPIDDNRFAGATTETDVTTPVIIPITPISDEELMITDTSLDESGVNVGEALTVTFNKALTSLTPVLYADGERVTVQYEIRNYNELIITRAVGWEEGVT